MAVTWPQLMKKLDKFYGITGKPHRSAGVKTQKCQARPSGKGCADLLRKMNLLVDMGLKLPFHKIFNLSRQRVPVTADQTFAYYLIQFMMKQLQYGQVRAAEPMHKLFASVPARLFGIYSMFISSMRDVIGHKGYSVVNRAGALAVFRKLKFNIAQFKPPTRPRP